MEKIIQSMLKNIKLDNLESLDIEKLIEPALNNIKTGDLQQASQMFEKNKDLISKFFGSEKLTEVFAPYLDLLFQNLKDVLESNKSTKEKIQTLQEIIKQKINKDIEENPNIKNEIDGLKDTFFNSMENIIKDPMALVDMFMTQNKPTRQSTTDKKLLRLEKLRNKLKNKNRLKN